jgi:HD-GYP domain-containing protein (c-di-GMP phosphodiesterase class II)
MTPNPDAAMTLVEANPDVAAHGREVARIATRIGNALGFDEEARATLGLAAGLHDIGKLPILRCHHERPDGNGYPDGLEGAAIPLQSRIIAVADAYDAMVSDRPYSSALSDAAARGELLRAPGAQFDRRIVAAFLGLRFRSRPWRQVAPARSFHAVA